MRGAWLVPFLVMGCASRAPLPERAPTSVATWRKPMSAAYLPEYTIADYTQMLSQSAIDATLSAGGYAAPEPAAHTPAGAELERRLQTIVTDLKQIFDLNGVPDPHLVISEKERPTAYILPIDVCVPGPVVVNGGSEYRRYVALTIANIGGRPQELGQRLTSCLDVRGRPGATRALETLMTYPTEVDDRRCTVERAAAAFNFTCAGAPAVQAERLAWTMQTPLVFISRAMLKLLASWEDFDAVMAHELGHYYRLHAVRMNEFGYYYDRTKQRDAVDPTRDYDLDEVAKIIRSLSGARNGPGYKDYFSSPLGAVLLERTISQLGRNGGAECQPYLAGPELRWTGPLIYQNYQAQEPALIAARRCLSSVHLPESEAGDYLAKFMPEKANWILTVLEPSAKHLPATSLWEAFRIQDAALARAVRKFWKSADVKRLGLYTYEEEADAFALNYLRARGRDPRQMEQMQVRLILGSAPWQNESTKKEVAECVAAYKRGWRTLRKPFYPVMDNVENQHHSYCFRLYNVGELARALKPSPPLTTPFPQDFWPFERVRADFL